MQSTDIPSRFPIPFANGAGAGFIRDIPTASSATPGAASLTDGFPDVCFQPIAAGGVPPAGEDFNGVLFRVSGWARWQAAGGPVTFNATFSTAVGGYPRGAFLQSAVTPGLFFVSTAENNTTNPDAVSSANWLTLVPTKASTAEVTAGTDDTKFISPLKLAELRASAADALDGSSVAKYISPAVLLDAFGFTNGERFIVFPGGLKLCWGQYRGTVTERRQDVSLPIAFDGVPFHAGGNAWNSSGSNEIDFWVQVMPQFYTTTSLAFYLNSSDGGSVQGFDWFAIGK